MTRTFGSRHCCTHTSGVLLLSLIWLLSLRALFVQPALSVSRSATNESSNASSRIIGYPGVLSRDLVRSIVDQELRTILLNWAATKNTPLPRKERKVRPKPNKSIQYHSKPHVRRRLERRQLKNDVNDILKSFEFEIPEQIIEQDFLGATATFVISGACSDISVNDIELDYQSRGDDLTYQVTVEGLDVDCAIDVEFDFGVYDVEDDITIDIELRENDFEIGVVLEGIPPESSSFEGCQAEIGLRDVDANGGFSANILNDLDFIIVDIVDQETETISDLLCEQVTQFTEVVDEVLMSFLELIEPYLGEPESVDPLQLEEDLGLDTDEECVDFTNTDLGFAVTVIVGNLEGVVGAEQVNKLVELNLLNEDGVFIVDLTEEEGEDDDVVDDDDDDESDRRHLQSEECSLIPARRLRRILFEALRIPPVPKDLHAGRHLQFGDGEEELFTINSLDILTIEVLGLNSFDSVELLEIIGKSTLQTKLQISEVTVRATVLLNADVNDVNIEEEIQVTVPIEDIELTASYLVCLKPSVVDQLSIQYILNTENLLVPCFFSALSVFALSELSVSVAEIGIPDVEGVLSSGVDELINTALEAAILHYQELIVDEAIPNFFQQNITMAINEFAECTIRTEGAAADCPPPTAAPDQEDSGLFDFGLKRTRVQESPLARSWLGQDP